MLTTRFGTPTSASFNIILTLKYPIYQHTFRKTLLFLISKIKPHSISFILFTICSRSLTQFHLTILIWIDIFIYLIPLCLANKAINYVCLIYEIIMSCPRESYYSFLDQLNGRNTYVRAKFKCWKCVFCICAAANHLHRLRAKIVAINTFQLKRQ